MAAFKIYTMQMCFSQKNTSVLAFPRLKNNKEKGEGKDFSSLSRSGRIADAKIYFQGHLPLKLLFLFEQNENGVGRKLSFFDSNVSLKNQFDLYF